jgi:hypothetical protein
MVVEVSDAELVATVVYGANRVFLEKMVLAEDSQPVPRIAQLRKGIGTRKLKRSAVIENSMPRRIEPGHEGCPARSAHRTGAEGVAENSSIGGKPGKPRRGDERMSCRRHEIMAHLVWIQYDDVRFLIFHMVFQLFFIQPGLTPRP